MEETDQKRFLSCYDEWMNQQISDLDDLLATRNTAVTDEQLKALVERCMAHYEDYVAKRRELAKRDAPALYCPTWCGAIENSLMWLGGCRPAIFIRLVYTLSGSDLDSNTGGGSNRMVALSTSQLRLVDELHRKTVAAEDKLTAWMATVQEDIADKPMLSLVREMGIGGEAESSSSYARDGFGGGGEAANAMERYAESMGKILEEADAMRVATARKLVTEILMPKQAVEMLAVAKQLHLSVHEWGRVHDRQRGRA